MFSRAIAFFYNILTAQPTGWTGASSRLEQAGFHALYQARFYADLHVPR